MKILKNSIFHNFSYLTLVHGVNLLSPIIIIPYLIKTLGISIYGEIVLSQSIMFYPAMFVGFGFNLIGTREVALHKTDINKRSEITNSVFTSKFILLITIGILIFSSLFPISNNRFKTLLILSFWVVIQEATIADWYFQAIEKMQLIALVNLVSKIFTFTYIFLLVKSTDDYFHVPLGFLIGILLSSIVTFFLIYKVEKNNFYISSISKVFNLLSESLPVFLSKFSQLYIRFNKILVGWFLNVDAVALFDIGEKLVNLIKLPITLFGQAIFPSFVQKRNMENLKKYVATFLLIHISLIFIGSFFQKELFSYFSLGVDKHSFFSILLSTLIPVTINVFFGNTVLFGLGYKKQYATSLIIAGLSYFIGVLFLYSFDIWSLLSISILILISEVSCSFLTTYYYLKLNVKS